MTSQQAIDFYVENHRNDYSPIERLFYFIQIEEWDLVKKFMNSNQSVLGLNYDFIDNESGETILTLLTKKGKIELIERLIELGADINFASKSKSTALHVSVRVGNEDLVALILNKNGNPNLLNEKNQLPIHLACGKPKVSLSIIKLLLKKSHRNSRLAYDSLGYIPIHYAIKAVNIDACKELLNELTQEQLVYETSVKKDTALHLSCRTKSINLIQLLLEKGAQVNAKNIDNQTPLHLSCWEGDANAVDLFYYYKADGNITDKHDRTPLHIATERGYNNVIEILINKYKSNCYLRTRDGSTLMHLASEYGFQKTALLFLKKGVPLHMPNKFGAISLHLACKKGHVDVVKALVQNGSHINARTRNNYTPLHVAVEHCRYQVVQILLGYGADVHVKGGKYKETPLHLAAKLYDTEKCAEVLLKSGAKPDAANDCGETPLHIASKFGQLKVVKVLLNEGSSPFIQSKKGESALHYAVRFINHNVVKEILEFVEKTKSKLDANMLLNTPNNDGETVLHYIAEIRKDLLSREFEDVDLLKLLMKYDTDIESQTKLTQETPLHYCAASGNVNILRELILDIDASKYQIVLNKQSKNGWSPLMVAAEQSNIETVKILFSYNARIDVFEENGKSVLHLASEQGNMEVVKLLLRRKVFINAKTKNGLTALHLACQYGHINLVQLLIENGSDVFALTLTKKTPLHLASEHGHIDVCILLIKFGGNVSITSCDIDGNTPLHLAAENDYANIIKLILKINPELAFAHNLNSGDNCAHIAASRGCIEVLKELFYFNKEMLITTKNRLNKATCIQLATAGGHKEAVKLLLAAGSNPLEENQDGMTPLHLGIKFNLRLRILQKLSYLKAAKLGNIEILDVLKIHVKLDFLSTMTGLSALHIASFYGRYEFCRELLEQVSANLSSEEPNERAIFEDIKLEAGLTPLHMAALSGHEGIIRLLLNSPNVNVHVSTTKTKSIPLHFAAENGHLVASGLLLSKYTSQLKTRNKTGKTAIHFAAINGHDQVLNLLIVQGANISIKDNQGYTALHYASLKGHLNVVKLLIESEAKTNVISNDGKIPLFYAASNLHIDVFEYFLNYDYNETTLLQDTKFLLYLIDCGKLTDNSSLRKFILSSKAPVYLAVKLSAAYRQLATIEKEIDKSLNEASNYCESIAVELLSIVSSLKNVEVLLKSVDKDFNQFVDVLIQSEQKEVLSQAVVQQYFTDVWNQNLKMSVFKIIGIFALILLVPLIWIILSLPFNIKLRNSNIVVNRIPMIKYMCFLISHLYFIALLFLTSVHPLVPIPEMSSSIPSVHEWLLLFWISGLLVSELKSPSDKGGLGVLKIAVLITSSIGCLLHLITFVVSSQDNLRYELFYARNLFFGITIVWCFLQMIEFLSLSYMFGPWAVMLREVIKDLIVFIVILIIFLFGFTCMTTAVYQPAYELTKNSGQDPNTNLRQPQNTLLLMYVTIFGLVSPDDLPTLNQVPLLGFYIQKILFGIYSLISAIILVTLLVATMTHTYDRIQRRSDIEWKFGRAKLIRGMSAQSTNSPTPLNIFTTLFKTLRAVWKFKKNIMNVEFVSFIDVDDDDENEINSAKKARMSIISRKSSVTNRIRTIERIINWKKVVCIYNKHKNDDEKLDIESDDYSGMEHEDDDIKGFSNDINELFVHACENGDYATVSKILDAAKDFNIEVTDYIGRSALRIAIENEHLEVVQILINRADSQKLREALLLAIFLGHTQIAESILRHPKYKSFSENKFLNRAVDSFWEKTSSDAQFSPDITPLILASQYQRTEIVQLLLINGDRIEKPHEFECKCNECSNKFKFDSLRHAQSRLNAYRGLSSESYISLASMDPIQTSFELGKEIRNLAQKEKYFKNEYLQLADNLSEYAVKLLNYVRGRDELDIILNKTGKENEEKYETLARLDLAIKYRETKFVAHSNCQQKLIEIWYSGIRSFSKLNQLAFFCLVLLFILVIPIVCLLHILLPRTKAGQWINQPFLKFISHTTSYFCFIAMIIVSSLTFAQEQQKCDLFSLTYPEYNASFVTYVNTQAFKYRFPTHDFYIRLHKPNYLDLVITLWILGYLISSIKKAYTEGLRTHIQSSQNIMNTLMTVLYLFSYGLKYYTILIVSSNRELIKSREFWNKVNNMNSNDLDTQKEVYEVFYWLNDDRFYWVSLDPINLAEGFFALANVFSITGLIFLLPAHQELGPLQITLGKMLSDVMRFIVIFMIIFAGFLFSLNNIFCYYQTSVRSEVEVEQHDADNMIAAQNFGTIGKTFGTIFWALFGLGNAQDTYLDSKYNSKVAENIGTAIYGAFHISTILLLINMLIAMMTKSYEKTRTNADSEWKFSRSILYLNYIKPGQALPSPFNLIPTTETCINCIRVLLSLVISFFKKLINKQESNKDFQEENNNNLSENGKKFRKNGEKIDSKISSVFDTELTYSRVIRRIIKRFLLRNQKEKEDIKSVDVDELKQDLQMVRYEIYNDLKKAKINSFKTMNRLHSSVSLVGEEFLKETKDKTLTDKFDDFKSYNNDFNDIINELDSKKMISK